MAIGANEPPRVNVAEVNAAVRSANSRVRSTRPTPNGATRNAARRPTLSGTGGPARPPRPARGSAGPKDTRMRVAAGRGRSRRGWRPPRPAADAGPWRRWVMCRWGGPRRRALWPRPAGRPRRCERVVHEVDPAGGRVLEVDGVRGRRVAQPVGHGGRAALRGGGLGQPPGAAGGRVDRGTRQFPVVAEVTRSTRSCASSMMTTWCRAARRCRTSASMASSAWLVTTMSAGRRFARARSANSRSRTGSGARRCTPARSPRLGARPPRARREPVRPGRRSSVSSAHSCSRFT